MFTQSKFSSHKCCCSFVFVYSKSQRQAETQLFYILVTVNKIGYICFKDFVFFLKMSRKAVKGTPPIYNFFPKSKDSQNHSMNDFYSEHLPNIPQNVEQSTQQLDAQNQIQQLKQKVEILTAENVKLRQENVKCHKEMAQLLKIHKETCRLYVNKELKVKILEKNVIPQDTILYDSFKEHFGDAVLIELRKIGASRRNDSSFILVCMRKLFENPEELKNVSACGTSQNSIFPTQRREILENIFLERLSNVNMKDEERSERYLRLNRLINVAIGNITRFTVSSIYIHYDNMKPILILYKRVMLHYLKERRMQLLLRRPIVPKILRR